MKFRFTLYRKLLIWFLLTFLLVNAVAIFVLAYEVDMKPETVLRGEGGPKFRAIFRLIFRELRHKPRENWDDILAKYSETEQAKIAVYDRSGNRIAGDNSVLPEKVKEALGSDHTEILETKNPDRRWIIVKVPRGRKGGAGGFRRQSGKYYIVLSSEARDRLQIFIKQVPWSLIISVVLGLSILFWLPMVRNLTGPIAQITKATEKIADGKFDVRVDERRSDEIGRMGKAINDMARRLEGLVQGQKSFLGEVSHELRSPLTRINVALEILEQSARDDQVPYFEDIKEEVVQMSDLVGELIAAVRAEVNPTKVIATKVPLRPLIDKVIRREVPENIIIEKEIQGDPVVMGDSELLARAISNVLRNAVRFAGDAGPISIRTWRDPGWVKLEIQDQGPGVPPEELTRLFEPFYRVQPDRDTATEGTGLGLAIVKTCIDACRGEVQVQNLQPNGFSVRISLPEEN